MTFHDVAALRTVGVLMLVFETFSGFGHVSCDIAVIG